jgi:autotransporter-associated beta strand protein
MQNNLGTALTVGSDSSNVLTVTSGLIGFGGTGTAAINLNIANVQLGNEGTFFEGSTSASQTATFASSITGSGTSAITKSGGGTLVLSGGSQYTGQLNVNQGVVNVRNGQALGSPSGATIVNNGAQLQLQGNITVMGEPVTLIGMGPGNGTGTNDGALLVVSGTPKWTSLPNPNNAVTISGVTTVDGSALFQNNAGTNNTLTGSAINVASGATFQLSGIMTSGGAGGDLVKLGGGTLELNGALANTLSAASVARVKSGTLFLNKAPGVAALGASTGTIVVGDGASSSATLKFGASNQLPIPASSVSATGNTAGNTTISGMSSTAGIVVGMIVTQPSVPGIANAIAANTTVTAVTATSVTISSNATATLNGVPLLFSGTPFTIAGTTQQNTKDIVGLASTANISVGTTITGSGIPANTIITAITSATSIQISNNATATSTVTLTINGGGGTNLVVGTNGIVDMTSTLPTQLRDQVIGSLTLQAGGAGSAASVNLGNSTLTTTGNVALQAVGQSNLTGATIQNGTLALNTYNSTSGVTEVFRVDDTGNSSNGTADLIITSAIVDGSGFAASGIQKVGLGDLQFGDGTTAGLPNTYTGTTTVSDGGLILNKGNGTGNVAAMSGPLVIGDGSLGGSTAAAGFAKTDVVRLAQDGQLPDFQGGVTVNASGWLDLKTNNNSDTIGTTDGQFALTVNGGVVETGTGTLTINGDISLTSSTSVTGVGASMTGAVAPSITGNVAFPARLDRRINIADNAALQSDGNVSAVLTNPTSSSDPTPAAADIRTTGAGALTLSGNNSGLTGNFFVQNTAPGAAVDNQPSVYVGSATALGVGIVNTTGTGNSLSADVPNLTIANRVLTTTGFSVAPGNDLTFTGSVDLLNNATINVNGNSTVTLNGGVGEVTTGKTLTKGGAGTLVITAVSTFSGNLTINQGTVVLKGNAALPNIGTITVAAGASLVLDDTAGTVQNTSQDGRIRNTSGITLSGGTLVHLGGSSPVAEELGAVTLTANTGTSNITQSAGSAATSMRFRSLTRNAGSFLNINSFGADVGTSDNNRVYFTTRPGLSGTGATNTQIIVGAVVNTVGDTDFAGYDDLAGVIKAVTSLNSFVPDGNIKLTQNTALPAATSTNGTFSNSSSNLSNLITNVTGLSAADIGKPIIATNVPGTLGGGAIPAGTTITQFIHLAAPLAGTTVAGSSTIAMANTTGILNGMGVTGANIPPGARVTAVSTNSSITISDVATAPGPTSLTFADSIQISNSVTASGTNVMLTLNSFQINGLLIRGTTGGAGVTLSGSTPLTVASGEIIATGDNNAITGTGTITLSPATGTSPGLLFAPTSNAATAVTISSPLVGPNGITKLGAGRIGLNGANTYAGQTDIMEGVLRVSNSSGLGSVNPAMTSSTQFDGATGTAVTSAAGVGSYVSGSSVITVLSTAGITTGMTVSSVLPNQGIAASTTVSQVIPSFSNTAAVSNTALTATLSGFGTEIANIKVGMPISGAGIPAGATVLTVTPGTPNTITISANTTTPPSPNYAIGTITFPNTIVLSTPTTLAGANVALRYSPAGSYTAGFTRSGTTQLSPNANVILMADTSNISVGTAVSGANIPLGSTVTAVTANTNITISGTGATTATTLNLLFGGNFVAVSSLTGILAPSTVGTTAVAGMGVQGAGIPATATVTSLVTQFSNSTALTNTSGTPTISGFTAGEIAKIKPGMLVTGGAAILSGTTVLTVTPGTPNTITISTNTQSAVTAIGAVTFPNQVQISSGATGSQTLTPLSFVNSGTTTSGTSTVTALTSMAGLAVGMVVNAAGVPNNTTINSLIPSFSTAATGLVNTSGTNTISGFTPAQIAQMVVGMGLTQTSASLFIPAGTTITSINTTNNSITISNNTTGAVAGSVTFLNSIVLSASASATATAVPLTVIANEVQMITIAPNNAITGTAPFTLSLVTPDGVTRTTTPIAWNSAAATLQSNIQNAVNTMLLAVPGAVATVGQPAVVAAAARGTLNGTKSVGITGSIASVNTITVGMQVVGAGIPADTTVTSVTNNGPNAITITLSNAAGTVASPVTNVPLSFLGTRFSLTFGTIAISGTTTILQSTVAMTTTLGIVPGMSVIGTGIPLGTTVTNVDAVHNTITISANALLSGTNSLTFRGGSLGNTNLNPLTISPFATLGGTVNTNTTVTVANVANLAVGMQVSGSGIAPNTVVTAITPQFSLAGTTQSGANAPTVLMANTSGILVGMQVSGTNIPAGATVTAINPNVSITISPSASAAGATTLTFANSVTVSNAATATAVNVGLTFSGGPKLLAGTNTLVRAGTAVELSGGITVSKPFDVSGGGIANTGALRNVSGSNTIAADVKLTTAGAGLSGVGIGADPGTTLTFGGTGVVSGTVGLTKLGPGVLELGGTSRNTFTGGMNINEGTERVNKTLVNAVQQLTFDGTPSGGSFTISYGPNTVKVPFTTIAAAVTSLNTATTGAMAQLFGVAANAVAARVGTTNSINITFGGALAGAPVSLLTADGSGLTGSGSLGIFVTPVTAVTTTTVGASTFKTTGSGNEVQRLTFSPNTTSGTFKLNFPLVTGTVTTQDTVTLTSIAYSATPASLADNIQTQVNTLLGGAAATARVTALAISATEIDLYYSGTNPSLKGNVGQVGVFAPTNSTAISPLPTITSFDGVEAIPAQAINVGDNVGSGTFFQAAQTVNAASTVTGLASTAGIVPGMTIDGPGIVTGTVVTGVIPSFTSSGLTNTSGQATISGFSAADIAKISVGMGVLPATGIPVNATVTVVNTGTNTITISGNTTSAVTSVTFANSVTMSAAANATAPAVTLAFGADLLVWANSDQIADSATVTVRPSGRLDLGTFNEAVGAGSGIVLQSGLTGAASVTSTGTLTSLGVSTALQANTLGNITAPQIAGKLELGTGARTISLQDSIGAVDLSVPATISATNFGGASAGLEHIYGRDLDPRRRIPAGEQQLTSAGHGRRRRRFRPQRGAGHHPRRLDGGDDVWI